MKTMRDKIAKESGISRRQILKGALLAGTGGVVVGVGGFELKPQATHVAAAPGQGHSGYRVTRHVLDYYQTLAQ